MTAKTSRTRKDSGRNGTLEVPLRNHAERALSDYFSNLNGHKPAHLYDLVLREVEEPLFRAVLDYSSGQPVPCRGHSRHQPREHCARNCSSSAFRADILFRDRLDARHDPQGPAVGLRQDGAG